MKESQHATNILAIASRNTATLRWLATQDEETILSIRMLYAGSLGCPLCEVTDELADIQSLEFVWNMFSSRIMTRGKRYIA